MLTKKFSRRSLLIGALGATLGLALGAHQTLAADFTVLKGTIIGTEGSYMNAGNDRTKAFDGDHSTFFDAPEDTNGNGVWVGLDLGEGKATQVVKIRYYPRDDMATRMVGGKFQGADNPEFKDAVTLHTVDAEPFEWMEVKKIDSDKKFRYLRYLSPDEGWGNIGEIEFLTK